MKMKTIPKYKILLMGAMAGLIMMSCADKLDIDPRQSISDNIALADYSGVQNALIGAWDALQHPNFLGSNYIINSECMAGNIFWGGSFVNFRDIAEKMILPDNASTQPYWMQGYQAIDRANKIIDVVRANTITEGVFLQNRDRILGNALVIRAISHFEMVRVYGQPPGYTSDNSHPGIPIVTKGTYLPSDAEKVSRATVAQVYAQIIEDLEEAINLLPASALKPFPTIITAKAIMARVYLECRNWEKAAELALEVIESDAYTLNDHPATFYRSSYTSESILEIAHTLSDNPRNTRADLANYWSIEERKDITIPPRVIEMYEDNDLRSELFMVEVQDTVTTWFSVRYMHQADNLPYLRYAEILLIRAEALAMLNPGQVPQEAVYLLGKIRERAQASHTIPETADELFEAIMLEREKELMHEGSFLFDLKRWRRDDVRFSRAPRNNNFIAWDDPRMIYPIPQREMDVNPNLDQNPGY
jgi:starch-binding outer membrane protein, SusD/RagB family